MTSFGSFPRVWRTLAHDGAKRYGESFDLVHRREATKPNSIWQADHAQLDIKLIKEDGTVGRPWLTIFLRNKRRFPSLSLDRFEEKFRHFLLEIYHRRSSIDGRLTPAERWEEGGFLPRMPESVEQLDLLLMQEVRARNIRRDGIHFQGLRYLSLTLAAYVGEDATIRFDPRDMGETASSTRIASFVERSPPSLPARLFRCGT